MQTVVWSAVEIHAAEEWGCLAPLQVSHSASARGFDEERGISRTILQARDKWVVVMDVEYEWDSVADSEADLLSVWLPLASARRRGCR